MKGGRKRQVPRTVLQAKENEFVLVLTTGDVIPSNESGNIKCMTCKIYKEVCYEKYRRVFCFFGTLNPLNLRGTDPGRSQLGISCMIQ